MTASETLGRRIARLRLARTATQERHKRAERESAGGEHGRTTLTIRYLAVARSCSRFLGVSVDELLSGASLLHLETAAVQGTLLLRRECCCGENGAAQESAAVKESGLRSCLCCR